MTKQTGLGDRFFIGGYDLSGDLGSLGAIGGGPAAVDVTGIDVSGHERIGGMFDGRMDWSTWFNPATDRAHERLSALPTGNVQAVYLRGQSLGGRGAGLVGKQPDYSGSRGDDGGLTFAAMVTAAEGYGINWGRQLTPGIRTDTEATSGASVDHGEATSFGLTAYLQVLDVVGTSVTVTLQSSSDDGSGDAFAAVTGGAFAAATGPEAQRITTADDASIERYLRVATSGTFTSAVFVVLVERHLTLRAF